MYLYIQDVGTAEAGPMSHNQKVITTITITTTISSLGVLNSSFIAGVIDVEAHAVHIFG